GHGAALRLFKDALAQNRLHHAWLFTGPKGIGKATLAYHLAQHLLREGDENIKALHDEALFARMAAGTEGNLRVIERSLNDKTGTLRAEIVVEDIRALHDFFEKTAARDGWRVAIIDSADEMNRNAANALLKILEEPPAKSVLFLISHAKGKLLPTVLSRCQQVSLNPLSPEEVAVAVKRLRPGISSKDAAALVELANGAPGFAVRLAANEGLKLKAAVDGLLDGKSLGTGAMHDLASTLSAKANEDAYFLFLELLTRAIGGKILALTEQESSTARLDCWLTLWDNVNRLAGEGEGLNLSRKQVLLLILEDVAATRKGTLAAA
ncbi:MAG TPA: DNA polymerase III subunit delta', partial [Sphingomonadales bacterium]|nr:DNA polymerase III subunit delta' [Sphingomonadales bacterium]